MEMGKKLYIGTNTKMYKTVRDTMDFLQMLSDNTSDIDRHRMELFVIPSYTALYTSGQQLDHSLIKLGAQNMCWEEQGQFSGEISPLMLKEAGADIVMIGHSERRHIFGEGDVEENKKVLSAVRHGLTALLCIGETGEEKEDGISNEVLRIQLKRGLKGLCPEQAGNVWVAYEPVWAIGVNGKPATSEYAEEKHQVIRECLDEIFEMDTWEQVPVLYGGSVNEENAEKLIQKEHVDGLFIGRSAWEARKFERIIRSVLPVFEERRRCAHEGCGYRM